MRANILGSSLLLCLFVLITVRAQSPETDATVREVVDQANADFAAIKTVAEKYAEAYNSGNADRIAQLYTTTAEFIDTESTVFRGRDLIQAEYDAFFLAHPKASIQINVDQLSFVAPHVAIEKGKTESRLAPDESPSFSTYVAVYAKVGGHWLLSHVRDEVLAQESGAKLEELSWLIGEWVDEAPESQMKINCYWHESGAYLIRDFSIEIEGLLASHGTERIGWDPLQQCVRSWLFDSEGGFLEGNWVKKNEQWTIATQGFRSDGVPTHATFSVTSLRDDAYHLSATNRTAGETELDDFEMTVVRRPPTPGVVPSLQTDGEKTEIPKNAE